MLSDGTKAMKTTNPSTRTGETERFTYGPPKDAEEFARMLAIARDTYLMTPELAQRYGTMQGMENFRTVRLNDSANGAEASPTNAGSLTLIHMGQHFGGRSVPTVGVGAVCVSPEHRAGGAASFMMRSTILEAHAKGIPLSTLYPATLKLYRSVGYQQAGSRHEIKVPLGEVNIDERGLHVRPLIDTDQPSIRALQHARARQSNGTLDRNEVMWKRASRPRDGEATGYGVFDDGGALLAYAYLYKKEGGGRFYSLLLSDLCVIGGAAGHQAGRRLWTFLAHHRSLADTVTWFGSPDDPFLKLLPERIAEIKLHFQWMLRVVDVPAALMARGWPRGISAELHLDVEDDLITANNGRYILELNDGSAQVSTGGRGDLKIDICGLAGLYSGHQSPIDLEMLGLLSAAGHVKDRDELYARAAAAFSPGAGGAAYLQEMF